MHLWCQVENDELSKRTLVRGSSDPDSRPTWFCVRGDAIAYYAGETVTILEYKL